MLPPTVCSVAYTNDNDRGRARDSTAGKRSLVAVASGSNPEVRRRMPTDPAVSRPNSTSILTVQCNGAVVRSSGYTNPIYFPRRTAVLYRRNSAVYF